MRMHFEAKFILGALLASLSAAPAVLAQSQSQTSAQDSSQATASAKTQGQSDASTSSSASTQAKTQNTSGNEPQMQSQEAPPQESLGEAARRARAQKTAAPAGKVFTEDKVAGLSGHGVSVVGDGNRSGDSTDAENAENSEREPSAGGAPKSNPASPQAGNSEEKMWREKAQAIHDQMAQIDAHRQDSGRNPEIWRGEHRSREWRASKHNLHRGPQRADQAAGRTESKTTEPA
jgi:hypothetical protein